MPIKTPEQIMSEVDTRHASPPMWSMAMILEAIKAYADQFAPKSPPIEQVRAAEGIIHGIRLFHNLSDATMETYVDFIRANKRVDQ
jgi:hypothetical protein